MRFYAVLYGCVRQESNIGARLDIAGLRGMKAVCVRNLETVFASPRILPDHGITQIGKVIENIAASGIK